MVVVIFLVLTVCDETFQFLYSQEVTCYSLMRLAPHCGHAMMCFFGGLVWLRGEPSCTILEAAVVQEKYGGVNDLGFQDGGTHFSVQGARVLPVWELGSVTLCWFFALLILEGWAKFKSEAWLQEHARSNRPSEMTMCLITRVRKDSLTSCLQAFFSCSWSYLCFDNNFAYVDPSCLWTVDRFRWSDCLESMLRHFAGAPGIYTELVPRACHIGLKSTANIFLRRMEDTLLLAVTESVSLSVAARDLLFILFRRNLFTGSPDIFSNRACNKLFLWGNQGSRAFTLPAFDASEVFFPPPSSASPPCDHSFDHVLQRSEFQWDGVGWGGAE